MSNKIYDLSVKIGTYESNGETKNRYQNVGAIIEGQHGPYMLLERTFNPAGVSGQEGRSSVIISLFKPKEDRGSKDEFASTKAAIGQRNNPEDFRNQPGPPQSFEDNIPF